MMGKGWRYERGSDSDGSVRGGSHAADIAGTWKATAEGPNGAIERTFVFKVDGTKLTGETTSTMLGQVHHHGREGGWRQSVVRYHRGFSGNGTETGVTKER